MASTDPEAAFLTAAREGNLMILRRLATKAGNGRLLEKAYETITDPRGQNALHLAAGLGHTSVCKFLVEELHYNIDSREEVLGHTPLLLAILTVKHPTAVYLIENGAGIECANNVGITALHIAAELGLNDILRLLLSKGAKLVPDTGCTPLQSACIVGKKDSVKLLLDNGADPNSTSKNYFTPLISSIHADSYECVELLLKAGADPNLSSYGETPMILAASYGDTRIINCLLKAGGNPNIIEPHGLMTPLEIVALNGKLPAVMALFPCTSRISSYPDWSVKGIMKHINSEEIKAQINIRRKEHFKVSKANGREAFERKDYEDAIQWYSQANDADPTDAAVLSNRSLCWVMLNRADRAIEDAKACVALKPDWPKAHYREGSAWRLIHVYSKASEAFSKALKLDPNNEEIKKAHRETVEALRLWKPCGANSKDE